MVVLEKDSKYKRFGGDLLVHVNVWTQNRVKNSCFEDNIEDERFYSQSWKIR
jgi:hypothetical protein